MKKISTLIFLLCSTVIWSQTVKQTTIAGQTYHVYPYPEYVSMGWHLERALKKHEEVDVAVIEGFYELEEAPQKKSISKVVRKNSDFFFNNHFVLETDITPSLDPLPDGKYVQFYSGYFKFDNKDKRVYDEQKVAGYFEIKNNVLHGAAYWLNTLGDTVKFGRFNEGKKEGVWTLRSTPNIQVYSAKNANEYCAQKPIYTVEKSTFNNGVLNGTYEKYESGDLIEKGNYTEGKESGEWFIYERVFDYDFIRKIAKTKVVLKQHFTYASKENISHKPYIRQQIFSYDLPRKYFVFSNYYEKPEIDFLRFWEYATNAESALELPEEAFNGYGDDMEMYGEYDGPEGTLEFPIDNYEDYTFVNGKMIEKCKLIDSIGIYNIYDGIYEEFYDNEQLKVRLEFKNGELVEEDTVFWENGKPFDVIYFDPIQNLYENRKYDFNGTLYEVNVYDVKGKFIKQTLDPYFRDKNIVIGNEKAILVEEPSYASRGISKWYTFEVNHNDTLSTENTLTGTITLEKKWYNDTTEWMNTVYDADQRVLTTTVKSCIGTATHDYSAEFDSEFKTIRGKSTFYLNDLQFIETFNGNFEPMRQFGLRDSFPQSRIVNPFLYSTTSEQVLYYKEHPFSGKVMLSTASETSISISANKIKIAISNGNEKFTKKLEKEFEKYKKTGKSKYKDILAISENRLFHGSIFSDFFPANNMLNLFQNKTNYDELTAMNLTSIVRIEGNMSQGKPDGIWRAFDKDNKLMSECVFSNGSLNGKLKSFAYAVPKPKKQDDLYMYDYEDPMAKFDSLPAKKVYYLQNELNFKNDMISGDEINYDWTGKILSKKTYVDGYEQGPAFERNSVLTVSLNYENGLPDGKIVTKLHLPGKDTLVINELNVQSGSLQGESKSYHTNGKISKRGFFLNGMPIDDYEGYDTLGTRFHYVKFEYSFPVEEKIWESNQLSVRYLFDWRDSIYFQPTDLYESTSVEALLYSTGLANGAYNTPYMGRPSLVEKGGIDYHMTKYFPNDSVSRDGALSSGKKVGCWQFFSYEGEKLYEVEYFDSVLKINDTIQFKSKGILFDFDATGNLLSKSYIIEKFEKYDCAHSDHYEVRQFYTFWQAHDSLHRINGYVKNYYDNGTIQSEGTMQNGLPTGIWKFYDPFGKLNKVGEYALGKRTGRWLNGDLSKTKYLGDICMNPNLPDLEEQIKRQEKLLDIYIEYFKNGKLLRTEFYGLDLNEFEEEGFEEPIDEK